MEVILASRHPPRHPYEVSFWLCLITSSDGELSLSQTTCFIIGP